MLYTKKLNLMLGISAAIVVIGLIVGFLMGGLNLGVEFSGGTLLTLDLKRADFDMNIVTSALNEHNIIGAQAVRTGTTTSSQTMVDIRMQTLGDDGIESAQRTNIVDTIRKTYPDVVITNVDRIGAVASNDLIRNAVLSILIASVLIMLYIWLRFEFLSGCAAIVGLVHDVLIMLSITCILRVPINSSFIAAVLTIVGYSINNTIVVFDRIRETSKRTANVEKNLDEIVNKSISATLARSINTSITTLLPITMIYLLGVESIREFSLPIIVGLLAGAYSSIFLAGPIWGHWSIARYKKDKQGALAGKSNKKGENRKKAK